MYIWFFYYNKVNELVCTFCILSCTGWLKLPQLHVISLIIFVNYILLKMLPNINNFVKYCLVCDNLK